jgi:hypothetical protein
MNLAIIAAALVFCSVATASVPDNWLREEAREAKVRGVGRSGLAPATGVVETIRRIEHGGLIPASFEFTVRMRDGSARISTTASADSWRSGDRILLIGGTAASITPSL